jgi:hypothetical protein
MNIQFPHKQLMLPQYTAGKLKSQLEALNTKLHAISWLSITPPSSNHQLSLVQEICSKAKLTKETWICNTKPGSEHLLVTPVAEPLS